MSLPRILVIDDQFARNATERTVFLANAGLSAGKVGTGGTTPYAEMEFCSGQREEDNRIVNDYAVVREAVVTGEWALVLLDVQFDSGGDAEGRPAGQSGDDFFGLIIRRQLLAEFTDLPVVMLTGKRHEEIGESDTPYLSKHKLGAYELRRTLLRFGKIEPAVSRSLLGLGEDIRADDPTTLAAFRMAFINAGKNSSVLILGESGTGKEVLARYVHRMSTRSAGPFVAVNAAAIPKDLVESELFGIATRVATGVNARQGKFELASGGTLFLDEIGDMPLETQVRVLRAIQEREIQRVGEAEEIPVDIRLVCATSRDLAARIASGDFREDLLYRINTVTITMPTLRERPGDIAPLVRAFLRKFAGNVEGLSWSPEALDVLEAQRFPGNVRELENLVQRIINTAGHNQVIGPRDVLDALAATTPPPRAEEVNTGVEPTSPTVQGNPTLQLSELAKWLDAVSVNKDDPALKGIKPVLDAAVQRLYQRLAGAVLERCRDPHDQSLNRQSAARLLTGDRNLKGKQPARLMNEILGKAQEHPIADEDLEALVREWRLGHRGKQNG